MKLGSKKLCIELDNGYNSPATPTKNEIKRINEDTPHKHYNEIAFVRSAYRYTKASSIHDDYNIISALIDTLPAHTSDTQINNDNNDNNVQLDYGTRYQMEKQAKNYFLIMPFGTWWNTALPIEDNITNLAKCQETFEILRHEYGVDNVLLKWICNTVRYLLKPYQFQRIISKKGRIKRLNLLFISHNSSNPEIYKFSEIKKCITIPHCINLSDYINAFIKTNKPISDDDYLINERTSNVSACNPLLNDEDRTAYDNIVICAQEGAEIFNQNQNKNTPIICLIKTIMNEFNDTFKESNYNKPNKFIPTPPPQPMTQQQLMQKSTTCKLVGGGRTGSSGRGGGSRRRGGAGRGQTHSQQSRNTMDDYDEESPQEYDADSRSQSESESDTNRNKSKRKSKHKQKKQSSNESMNKHSDRNRNKKSLV